MIISSTDNQKIKEIRSLKEKKFRDISGLYLVVGEKSVVEAFKFKQSVKYIVFSENYKGIMPNGNTEIIETTEKIFKTLSEDINPQGILAVLYKHNNTISSVLEKALLLDGVSDPGNMGTIIRSAVAFGFEDIFLRNTVDPYNLKTVKASMSGIFNVNFYDITGKDIKNAINLPIISADMKGEDIKNFKKIEKYCLAIGNEANGISLDVKEISYKTVSIPMNLKMESLNAGVSAGILMYLLNQNT